MMRRTPLKKQHTTVGKKIKILKIYLKKKLSIKSISLSLNCNVKYLNDFIRNNILFIIQYY